MTTNSPPPPQTRKHDAPEALEPGAPPAGPPQSLSPSNTQAPVAAPSLPMPREGEESPETSSADPDSKMLQAQRDIEAGQVDTDMRAIPGQDAVLRERLVPGPGGKRVPPGS